MTPERWQRVDALLDAALDRPPGDRAAFVDQACSDDPTLSREVKALLDHDDPDFIDRPAFDLHGEDPATGRRIGPYRLRRLLGRGGMGAVYLAVREDDYRQQVALKLIKQGMDSAQIVHRFHNERQILASLDHPSIARILDGGTTGDGLPYFAMEYVEGQPIDRYCDAGKLTTRDRLRLFRQVCAAVHLAHQNLVVHRDLKPGNILVTTGGTPKLLDFGIAKLLAPEGAAGALTTAFGQQPMTLRYASPEQVRGESINTRSDVYSLGVLLYELLTGHAPYNLLGSTLGECIRRICEEEPRRPSTAVRRDAEIRRPDGTTRQLTPEGVSRTRDGDPRKLRRRLTGDLDDIVLMALRKEPEKRYGSVEQLSLDLRRHLDGLPVVARRGTVLYRSAKFLRRNRWRLATAAVLLLVIAAGVTTRIWSARQIAQAEIAEGLSAERAREAQRQAEIRAELLQNLFTASDLDRNHRFTVRQLLVRGEGRIRENLRREPLATQLESLGLIYGDLGLKDEAREQFEDCLELRRGLYGGDDPLLARALNNLAAWHYRAGGYEEAGQLYRDALDMRRRLGEEGLYLVKAISNQASILMNRGGYAEAEELYREALAIREDAYGPEDPAVASSLRSLGILLYIRSDFERAEPLLRRALEIRRRSFGAEDQRVAAAGSSLARVLHARGRHREAEELYAAVLAVRRQRLGEDHSHVALTKKDLAALFLDQGRPAAAGKLLDEALAILRGSLPEDAWQIADAESLLGAWRVQQGRYQEAEPYLHDSYATLRKLRGERAVYTENAHRRLVGLYAAWGKPLPAWLRGDPGAPTDG